MRPPKHEGQRSISRCSGREAQPGNPLSQNGGAGALAGGTLRRMISLGTYPTPVQHLPMLSSPRTALWIKRDDQTNPRYGGNKVRKLEHLLADAKERHAKRIVTVGAVGSNHVLA